VVVVLLALSCSSQVQNQEEDDSPPGYADVVIGKNESGVLTISIRSVEESADSPGHIRCGRSENDKCKAHSPITWSVYNNSGVDVRVVMTNFTIGERRESPFNLDPERKRIGTGDRRPVFRNIKNAPEESTYKYDILVYSGDQVIVRLDPRIDI
jgi:hypothetical protein